MGVVLIKHRNESKWTALLGFGYLIISTNVRRYYRVVHLVYLAFNTVQLLQCKTLNFLSPELRPHELDSTDSEH